MKKLEFDVYVGIKTSNIQNDRIIASVVPKFYFPQGKWYANGLEKENGVEYFINIYDLGTYFADWIDLIENESKISATIYLNIYSLKRVFKGKEIISIIDKIEKHQNFRNVRDFKELV